MPLKILLCLVFVFTGHILTAQTTETRFVYPKKDSLAAINTSRNDSLTSNKITHRKSPAGNSTDLNWPAPNKNAGLKKQHYIWLGLNIEPQFQNIFKSRKEFADYAAATGGYLKLPGSGGVQTGFKLHYLPAGLAGFETGLQYHFYESDLMQVQPVTGILVAYLVRNKFHNLEVPLMVNVHSHGRNVRFYSSNGISAGVTVGASHTSSLSAAGYPSQTRSFITAASDSTAFFYATILASAGLQASITPHILFNLTLAFRISSSSVLGATNPNYATGSYPFVPYSLGLNAEILFQTHEKNKNRNGSFSLPASVTNSNNKEQKNLDKLKEKHKSWYACFVIMLNGDTLRGKVRESEDYELTGFLFTSGKFTMAHTDEREEKLGAAQIKELYVPGESREFRKYIALPSRNEAESREIFRVLADGDCKLLSTEINGPGVGKPSDKAYVYYMSLLTQVSLKEAAAQTREFKDQCTKVFADCPALLQQLQNNTRHFADMPEIIQAFNQCISKH